MKDIQHLFQYPNIRNSADGDAQTNRQQQSSRYYIQHTISIIYICTSTKVRATQYFFFPFER